MVLPTLILCRIGDDYPASAPLKETSNGGLERHFKESSIKPRSLLKKIGGSLKRFGREYRSPSLRKHRHPQPFALVLAKVKA